MISIPEEVMHAALRITTLFHPVTEQEKADVLMVLREAAKYPSKFPVQS